jgi:hypothetical protein
LLAATWEEEANPEIAARTGLPRAWVDDEITESNA